MAAVNSPFKSNKLVSSLQTVTSVRGDEHSDQAALEPTLGVGAEIGGGSSGPSEQLEAC